MLEEASRNVKPSGDNASAKNDSQDESANFNNKSSADRPSGIAKSNQKKNDNSYLGSSEPFDSSLTSVNDRPLLQEGANTSGGYQNALVEKLQSLGVDQEKIDALLNLLSLDAADAQESIAALAGPLGLAQNAAPKNSLQGPQKAGEPSAALNGRDRLALDFLRQAGFSEAESKDLLQKIVRIDTGRINTDRPNLQGAQAENGNPDAANVIRSAHAQVRENRGEAAGELIRQQTLELRQQKTTGGTANNRDITSTGRIPIQDDLAKLLNPVHQTRQEPLNETAIQAALANSPNLRNPQDNISPADTNTVKLSTEFVSQADVQAAEKPSGHFNGKQTAQTISLPRGVTENNLMDQIARKISVRGNGAKNEIHIRLEPPSLGTVRMNISTTGDVMKTTIITENHAVRQTIENNLSQLKHSLSQQGLVVENLNVLVGGDSGFAGQNQQQPEGRQFSGPALNRPADRQAAEPLVAESRAPSFAATGKINVFI